VFNKFNGEGHPTTKGDLIIGNDAWFCYNVTIMSCVTIGDGAVIANNSRFVRPFTFQTPNIFAFEM